MKALLSVCFFLPLTAVTVLAQSNDDLSSTYQFNVTLVDDNYWLYWSFSSTTQIISFAVRVKTTGWIGFGISPTGQMPGSDVVIGWIDVSRSYFHDRYAESTGYTPQIDPIQNWFLTEASVNNGYTTLKFYRNFTSCDTRDLNILPEVMQVVYSWNDAKPTITLTPNGQETFSISKHTHRGAAAVNLLSRFPQPVVSSIEQELFVGNENANIPTASTSYWCKAIRLPLSIRQGAKYITKFTARITSGNKRYISDMFVYLCDGLETEDVTNSGSSCNLNGPRTRITNCFNQRVIAVWGRGDRGEEFVYPSHVAHKLGGPDSPLFITIRIHFEGITSTIQDSSGIQLTYISTPRQYNGAILNIGHYLAPNMIIPPKSASYNITGLCSGTCTENNFPTSGINIFANLFHTGRQASSLEINHIGRTLCSGSPFNEELKSIDRNIHYNETQQETTYFLNEVKVNPGDSISLMCSYNTVQENGVILGGTSTGEETCQSYLFYYPHTEMYTCTSYPQFSNFDDFITSEVPSADQSAFQSLNLDARSSSSSSSSQIASTMNRIEWTQQQRDAFQNMAYGRGTKQSSICNSEISTVSLPSIPSCCVYDPGNVCTSQVEGTNTPCCQRECVVSALMRSGAGSKTAICLNNILLIIVMTLVIGLALHAGSS